MRAAAGRWIMYSSCPSLSWCSALGFIRAGRPKGKAPGSKSSCFASPTSSRHRTYPSFSLSARKQQPQHSTAVRSLLCARNLSYAALSGAPEALHQLRQSSTPAIDAPRPAFGLCCRPSSHCPVLLARPLPEGRCSWGCHLEPRSQDPSPCRTRTMLSSVRCGTTMGQHVGSAAPA